MVDDCIMCVLGLPYVFTVGISLTAESNWAIAMKKLLKEGAAAEPHPHSGIDTPISIQEELFKYL